LDILRSVLKHIGSLSFSKQKHILKRVNADQQTTLMLLSRSNNPEAGNIMLTFGKMLIQHQFKLQSNTGENCINISVMFGNSYFFIYFLNL
jgi:hypothetical protein